MKKLTDITIEMFGLDNVSCMRIGPDVPSKGIYVWSIMNEVLVDKKESYYEALNLAEKYEKVTGEDFKLKKQY